MHNFGFMTEERTIGLVLALWMKIMETGWTKPKVIIDISEFSEYSK